MNEHASRLVVLACLSLGVAIACGGEGSEDGGTSMDAAALDAAAVDSGFVCAADFECDDGMYCTGIERCVDTACQPGDPPCDASTHRCDEAGEGCTPIDCSEPDVDGDGHDSIACGGGDCDDDDAQRNPGNMEICDASDVDEDCDPVTYGFRDADMDGDPDARCCNGENCGSDCDDMRPGVNTTVPEVCGNGLDDDCDGMMDEGLLMDGYADPDGDGWGDSTMPMTGVCPGAAGFAAMGGDCDESNPAIHPGATEACDEIDNNCSGVADEGLPTMVCYRDLDADGYGETAVSERRCGCGDGWATLPGDCADWEPDAHPGVDFRTGCYCPLRPPMSCGGLICGPGTSADWNCDGREEQRWTGTLYSCAMFVAGGCSGLFEEAVWVGDSPPPCGFQALADICHDDAVCSSDRLNVTQQCR